MKYIIKQSGFSAVELLITLFIAAAFLISGYQLYAVVIKDGGEARMQAKATNVATDYLQQYKLTAQNPCATASSTPLVNSNAISGLSNVTITETISCPYGSSLATGGTKSISGAYTLHTFNSTGQIFTPYSAINVEAIVVGGGGGGGGAMGGGGGGGGVLYNASLPVTAQDYTVTVGASGSGGIGTSNAAGSNGGPSSFSTLSVLGGGGGGYYTGAANAGKAGGSGGGGGGYLSGTGGLNTAGQGNIGGAGNSNYLAGGGGGAQAAGQAGQSQVAGYGGAGVQYPISAQYYSGGGGGGGYYAITCTGGAGGSDGGAGTCTDSGNGIAGKPYTGSGGGGGGYAGGIGGGGGSGIVIIRYLTPTPSITSISKVLVTITYGSPQQTITNATYVKP